MNVKEVDRIIEKLHVNGSGPLRELFYTKIGLPRQGLYSNDEILNRIDIDTRAMNLLEVKGVKITLNGSLAYLRRQAKEAGLAWIDWNTTVEGSGRGFSKHGFLNDIDKIVDNTSKFDKIAEQHANIAELTRGVDDVKIALLKDEGRAKLKNNKRAKLNK